MISAIDNTLVEQLVETRNVMNFFVNDLQSSVVVNPQALVHIFNGPDIGVGFFQNMFPVG